MSFHLIIDSSDVVVGVSAAGDGSIVLPDNCELVASDSFIPPGMVRQSDGSYSPPPIPSRVVDVPQEISRRQFFQQLAADGDITQDEALAAVTSGTLPKKLSDAVNGLPASQQFEAKMLLGGATSFLRSHPMVGILGAALQKNEAALDALWTEASAL